MTRGKDIKTKRDHISPPLNNYEHHLNIATVWCGGKQKLEGQRTGNSCVASSKSVFVFLFQGQDLWNNVSLTSVPTFSSLIK